MHVAADWPGYFPNGPAVVRLLIGAGADPDAPVAGSWHCKTPLHWAASSDDVNVADALIDGGANVEAQGASIGGGTPLDDAVHSLRATGLGLVIGIVGLIWEPAG